MGRPFVFLSIPLSIGIILSYFFDFNMAGSMLFLGLFLILSGFLILKNKLAMIPLFFSLLFLGIFLNSTRGQSSYLRDFVGRELLLNATVDQINWQDEDAGKYVIKIQSILDGNNEEEINEKSVLKVYGGNKLQIGDSIVFSGVPKEPMPNTNPMLYNYKLYLMTNNIFTTINIKDYSIKEINRDNMDFKYKIRESFRHNIEGLFDKYLQEENSSLIKGIVLGQYSYLEEEDILMFRELGLAHILAVSGLHIGIISGFLIYVLSYLGVKRKYSVFFTLFVLWLYGYLIGFPPSLLRAIIMLSIYFLGFIFAEPYDGINSLFFAFFVMIIINPMWIFNLGFQLSFMATFSIIYFTPKIREVFYPYDGKILRTIWGLLGVQIGLLPLQAYYFNRIYLISIMTNLILAPILGLALIIGTIMIALSYTLAVFNPIVGKILDFVLTLETHMADLFYGLGVGIVKIHSPNAFEFIMYFVILLFLFKVIDLKYLDFKIKKVFLIYLIILLLFNTAVIMTDNSMEIHFLDVGQGDSILLRTKKGDYLVDTGGNIFDSFDIGENITSPYLEKLGIKRLRGVFITHFDDDHSKALPLLLDNIDIDHIIVSYEDYDNFIFREIKDRGKSPLLLRENDKINIDKNTVIKVLGPSENLKNNSLSPNNLSLVFLLTYFDYKVLFTGDMEREAEYELIDKAEGPVDILKVPHHGSNTSSTEELLNIIKPEIGVISLGRNNFYGHPNVEVLERYNRLGTEIHRTDTEGMILVKLFNGDKVILPYINEKKDFTEFILDNAVIISLYIGVFLALYVLTKIYIFQKERLIPYEL
ncbi:MAG: DNA internalization-related competence protein ComEC/Rec2 [Tissierellaceae bacterium]|nr:DNA internalization-related competence protein ComEC/Rec2 [Tissierellaceae bacterium]